MPIRNKIITEFKGLKTVIKDPKKLEDGQPQDSLNWLTGRNKDHIELRGGTKLLGTTRNTGTGKITGLKTGYNKSGQQIPFFSYGRKLKYYDATTDDTIEIGTDILPLTASGEDVSMDFYSNLAGNFVYISSPNSSIYKVHLSYPSYAQNQGTSDTKGRIKIKQNRMFLWHNLAESTKSLNTTGLLVSYIDKQNYSDYTLTTGETLGTGDGVNKTFTGFLANRSSVATIFNLVVKGGGGITGITPSGSGSGYAISDILTIQGGDYNATITVTGINPQKDITTATITTAGSGYVAGSLYDVKGGTGTGAKILISTVGKGGTFSDNGDGTLSCSDGGTGTINYITGAYSITFGVAPSNGQAVVASYYTENSTSTGICDFTFSATRTKGQGMIISQNGGGELMNLFAVGQDIICLHRANSWDLIIPNSDDTQTTNDAYRGKVNMPYWRSGDETDDGVLALFLGDNNYPSLNLLTTGDYTTAIVPRNLSEGMDFTPYGIDYPVVKRWGDYEVLCVQNQTNGTNDPNNNVMFVRNVNSQTWDRLDYSASCLDTYNGFLLAGDNLSNNVFVLFSGYDDDGDLIKNYWTSNQSNLDFGGTKKFTKFYIDGFIAKSQSFDILLQYDNGDFVKVGSVNGTDSYVDTGAGITVGAETVGTQVVGGGSVPNAYHFQKEFTVASPIFNDITVKFQATSVGALQINEYGFMDIRYKNTKVIPTYYN